MRQEIWDLLSGYVPCDRQEESDRDVMLRYTRMFDDVLERRNRFGHFTASPWIVNRERTKVLLVYHRIYDSWGWCGGHCDGDGDFLRVALREGREETGLASIAPCTEEIFALDVLPVAPHVRRGAFVSAHVHLNVTYLCTADEEEPLHHKEDETRGAMWVPAGQVEELVSPWDRLMIPVYRKLNRKAKIPAGG